MKLNSVNATNFTGVKIPQDVAKGMMKYVESVSAPKAQLIGTERMGEIVNLLNTKSGDKFDIVIREVTPAKDAIVFGLKGVFNGGVIHESKLGFTNEMLFSPDKAASKHFDVDIQKFCIEVLEKIDAKKQLGKLSELLSQFTVK